MQGLDLCENYFSKVGLPMIEAKFPACRQRIAAGLVGSGSECFGFDDEISRDHDWGPAFCLWLNKEDFEQFGADLQKEYEKLPGDFAGWTRQESDWGSGRTGVFEIGQFYRQFIGFNRVPADLREWRLIPETYLATATNGRVFIDPAGEFTAFRNRLKEFYPNDIRLKKIAARCMTMGQAGQYNYMRCVRRKELVAAQCAEAEFLNAAVSMVFLLNRQYRPFYKWMHRAMRDLPVLGGVVYDLCSTMAAAPETESGPRIYEKKVFLIEEICRHIISELTWQGLSDSGSDFLLHHGPQVQERIKDPLIKSISVWAE